MNKKGQTILSEYVMVFFVVIAAIVAMSTFVQRGFQGRIHDARNYMINAVMNSAVCDVNCLAATGNRIGYEYEPYYAQMLTDVQQNEQENTGATTGNSAVIGAIYGKVNTEASKSVSTSTQLPPACADGVNPKPSYCINFQLPVSSN